MKLHVVKVRLKFISDMPSPISAWSGSFSLKLIYDYFKRINIDFEKRIKKPFITEPLIHNGNYILTGFYAKKEDDYVAIGDPFFLNANDEVELRITFLKSQALQDFIEAFARDNVLNEPSGIFVADGLIYREIDMPLLEFKEGNEWTDFEIKVDFLTPTNFAFHGRQITYPSPTRFFYSIASEYSRLTKKDHRKEFETIMLKGIELLGYKIKRFFVNIGEGRKVPCFMGEATYAISVKEGYVEAMSKLFNWAEIIGVGKSRAMGFGRVKIEVK